MMGALVVDKKEKFLEQFRIAKGLSGMSKAAELALEKLSFPSTRDEYWKYTRLAKIQNSEFSVKEFDRTAEVHSINERALHIECINGFFQTPVGEIQTGIEGVEFTEVKSGLNENDKVVINGNFLIDAQSQLSGYNMIHNH